MTSFDISKIKQIWFIDFEFIVSGGNRPEPVCLVAYEYWSQNLIRLWKDELINSKTSPYAIDESSIIVAYYASAEMSCHLELGWKLPVHLVDLYVEFRNIVNGTELPFNPALRRKVGYSLIDALSFFRLDSISYYDKEYMRDLILGGEWSEDEQKQIIDYCESDVNALFKLWPKMMKKVEIVYALLRGSYVKAVAIIERNGIPIDHDMLTLLNENWELIKGKLISEVDKDYLIYEKGSFKQRNFEAWLSDQGINWPRLESGKLDLKDETFRTMSKMYPSVAPLRELRSSLSRMRLNELSIGSDRRNRCLLSPFGSTTGRNQPSNKKSIFGPSVWLRNLVKPEAGFSLAYIDWSQQEFGIAAALSGDENMKDAYKSGDPYLQFAKQAGYVPETATKETHNTERELFKQCALGVLYGMGAQGLSSRIGRTEEDARYLIALHRKTFPQFWRWIDRVVEYAYLKGSLRTVFGWTLNVDSETKTGTVKNYLMQANGAEMLRLACCLAIEKGVKICLPVHDALLIEAPVDEIEESIRITQQAMADVSKLVLGDLELKSDVKRVDYPNRYSDVRGEKMWDVVNTIIQRDILTDIDKGRGVHVG